MEIREKLRYEKVATKMPYSFECIQPVTKKEKWSKHNFIAGKSIQPVTKKERWSKHNFIAGNAFVT